MDPLKKLLYPAPDGKVAVNQGPLLVMLGMAAGRRGHDPGGDLGDMAELLFADFGPGLKDGGT